MKNEQRMEPPALRAQVFIYLGLTSLIWLVFGQTLGHPFVAYDDQNYVYENPAVTAGLSSDGIRVAFTKPHARNWHPLTTLSHMLDVQLFGLNPAGHHFTNVLLHTFAALLLFSLLRRITGSTWRSAFVAAIFAIHPLRVESVAWVAERKDVLSAFCFMLTLIMYARYVARPSTPRYLAVLVPFALGLMAKPMLVTLPFLLFALDYWPLRRLKTRDAGEEPTPSLGRLILEKVPLLFLAAAAGVATLLAQRFTIGYGEQTPLLWRLGNASIACLVYIGQMFWPTRLAAFYPWPTNGWPIAAIALSVGVLALVTVLAFWFRKNRPYLIVGWLWYLISLSPTLGLIPVGLQAHADRYTYLPHIGLYFALAWLAGDLVARFPATQKLRMLLAPAAIAAATWLAWVQTTSWQSTETLWRHTLAVTPNNDVGNYNLALLETRRHRIDDAIRHLESALDGRSDRETSFHFSTALLHNLLGIALARKGREQEAIAHYRKAVELRDDFADAHTNLATALLAKGATSEAIEHFRKAKNLPPEDALSHLRLAAALDRSEQTVEAISEYRRSLVLDPRNPKAHYLLAKALDLAGNRDEARIEAARAVELDSSQPEFKALQEQLNEK